jgi:hypothetical protein
MYLDYGYKYTASALETELQDLMVSAMNDKDSRNHDIDGLYALLRIQLVRTMPISSTE